MALIVADRVQETSTTTGAGAYTLLGATTGYRTAGSVCVPGDTFTYYAEAIDDLGRPTGAWETGLGTWGTGNILTRTTIYASSNAGAAVSWGSGTRKIGLGLVSKAALGPTSITGTLAATGNITGANLSGTNTGDQSASAILNAIKTVDGTGSGLDADLLDGAEGSTYLKNNIATTTIGTGITGSQIWLDVSNPGVGTSSGFRFLKANDSAGIAVTENTSDSTLYEFYMSDNPDGGDYFSWRFSDHQGSNGLWQPIQLGGITNQYVARTHTFYGNVVQNTGRFYSTSNTGGTANSVYMQSFNTISKLKIAGSGTNLISNLDISSYTGSSGAVFTLKVLAGNTTFDWRYGRSDVAAVQTGLSISTTPVTLSNGIRITFASATGSLLGDIFQCRVFREVANTLGPTTVVGNISATNFTGSSSGTNTGDQTLPTALPTPNTVTFTTAGGAVAGTTFNGSVARTIDYSTVGAAAAGHTHSYQAADADLLAIGGLTGTSGLLRKTAADTWTLDTAAYSTTTGTVTSVATSGAITGGTITNTGTIGHSTADGNLHVPATSTTNNGKVLTAGATAGSLSWATPKVGTVTSISMTVPTGLTIGGSPITTSGTLALSLTAGYSIPTTASQTNWNTAYTDRSKWDGGSTGLVAATGRTSLGGTTVGQNLFTLTNPTAVTFPRFNADNTVSALNAATFRTAIGAGTSSTTGTVTGVTGTAPVVSSGGTAPAISMAAATASVNGYMTNTYASKLDGIAASANNYVHPTGDGNLHVPATSTTNNGKVLTAGATAGSLSWATPKVGTVTSVTAGNGMTQTGTSTINPTLNIVSHAGTAGTIGTINIGADAIGVNLGTTSTTAARGDHTHAYLSVESDTLATVTGRGSTTTTNLTINNGSPTIYFQDTDQNSAMLHNNSNLFYILRGANNSVTWTQVGSYWPVYWDLTNNNATFGGAIWAAGNITAYSDIKLKENIKTVDGALSKVTQLRGVYYTLKRDETKTRKIGVIAQEIQQVLPEVVLLHRDNEDTEGTLSVDYGNITAVLIEAIKEQKTIIDSQESRIARLEALVNKLVD